MKKIAITLLLLIFSIPAFAQQEQEQLSFDQILEADAKHNLNVAWQYFKLKKAYLAVLMRGEETLAAHPGFSKMDELFYLLGMSSYYLSIGKGKQKIDLDKLGEDERERFTPTRLKEDAFAYLSKLTEEFPDSKYAGKAQGTLKKLAPQEK